MRKIACTLLFLAAMPLACSQTLRDELPADPSSVMLQGKLATKTTDQIELTWSYALDMTTGLTVQYRVKNLTPSNLYVLDRLWQLGAHVAALFPLAQAAAAHEKSREGRTRGKLVIVV
jgi:hypothetical protein